MKLYRKLHNLAAKSPFLVKTARNIIGSDIINNSPIYQYIALQRAQKLHRSRPFGLKTLCIETTLACNARCIMCTRRSFPHKIGTMSDAVYQKTLNEAKDIGVKELGLSVYGEPLLDPKFVQRATLADKLGFQFYFFSNASLLTESLARQLLQLPGFTSVYFSINGFSKKTYEEIMVGLDRDKVFANVLRFLELIKESNRRIKVIIDCVVFEKNIHEVKDIKRFWHSKEGVDTVYFPVIRNRGGTRLDIEADSDKVEFSPLSKKNRKLHPCRYLWEGIFVYWNGDVGGCCEDNAARRIVVGNIANQSLADIWNGPKMNSLRKLHLDGKRAMHPVCGKQCSYNTAWLFQSA